MQDEQQRVDSQIDPVSTVSTETPDTQIDTQQPPEQDPAGHGDAQDGSDAGTETPTKPDDREAEYQRLKREEGKLRQTQEELKAVKQQTDTYINWALSSPERAKQVLVEVEGRSEQEADRIINNAKQRNPNLWNGSGTQAQQPTHQIVDPYEAYHQMRNLEKAQEAFFTAVPEMDPKNVKEAEREEKARLAGEVDYLARSLMNIDRSLDLGTAWVEAYKIRTHKTDADVAKAREQGKIEGMITANADRATNTPAPVGSKPTSQGSVQLSEYERSVADQLIKQGVFKSYDEYAQYKQD